ncbi:hypothetical protein [Glaciimonas sp. GG7]
MNELKRRPDAPSLNTFSRSAFGLLGATSRDSRHSIVALAEEKSLFLDPDICVKARQDLTNPRNRLASEMAWLPGLSPTRVADYCLLLDGDLKALLFAASTEQPLVRANLLAAGAELLSPAASADLWGNWILKLSVATDAIDVSEILRTINEERGVAGFPEIQSLKAVADELTERRRIFKDVVRAAINRMPTAKMLEVMSLVTEIATNSGEKQAPMIIDDLVDSYALDARSFLEKEAGNISKLIDATKEAAPQGASSVQPLLDKLDAVVRNWCKVARPIQLSMKARGLAHDLSRDTGFGLRGLSIDMFNEHDLLDCSRRLTDLLQELFSGFPELLERLSDDVQTLADIARQQGYLKLLNPLRNLCKEAGENADSNASTADRQAQRIISEAPTLISNLEKAGAPADIVSQGKDEIALAVVHCAVEFGNKSEEWSTCVGLLEDALRLGVGSEIRERIAANLEIVERNVRLYRDLKPISSAPSLRTINGFGCKLYGHTDDDRESGSYMSTYYFVALFIPIFPICRYRVIYSGVNSYRFLGKGPLRTFDKWHIAISIGIIVWLFAFAK